MPGLRRKVVAAIVTLIVMHAYAALAEVKLVTIDAPKSEAWVGQKVAFYVKLRGKGPFVGAASFSLPAVPRTVILKVGNPVVSNEEIEDESWFVQTHEFVLFSQADGALEVPAFDVRYASRDSFTGPAKDYREQVPAIQFQIERPPESDPATFLVTTDSLKVTEQWDPTPGKTQQGAVFHRTITQNAEQVTGMALAPPPTKEPAGVSVHFDDPVITDDTERGAFAGSRSDRITYVLEEPGNATLPAIQYVWWNPDKQEYGSTTLPAATFEVTAVATADDSAPANERDFSWLLWLLVVLAAGGLCYWQRRRLQESFCSLWEKLNPLERRIARELLRACRRSDAPAAETAWLEWQATVSPPQNVSPRLATAATELQRTLYGCGDPSTWNGSEMAAAFREATAMDHEKRPETGALPRLNPTR